MNELNEMIDNMHTPTVEIILEGRGKECSPKSRLSKFDQLIEAMPLRVGQACAF